MLARNGWHGFTVRAVAQEADMALATAQHYLTTRGSMVEAAMDALEERVMVRARLIPERVSHPADVVREALLQVLPLDAERTVEGRAWLALTAGSLSDKDIAHAVTARETQFGANVARLLSGIPVEDPEGAAEEITTVVDGMTVRLLTFSLTGSAAIQQLDALLARIGATARD